jgi:2-dehydropantoate 2-reductase
MKWSKMLTNLLSNATSAILDLTAREVFAHPGLYRVEMEQLREALRVMDRLGLKAVDLPGTPVRLLAFAARYLPPGLSRPLMRKAVGGGRGGKMPSFHIDLYGSRKVTEVEFLHGAVARHAEENGLAAPVNRALADTLTALSLGKLDQAHFARRPERLLEIMDAARRGSPRPG